VAETAAAVAIFDEEGRILLVRERELWAYPGGRLEPGETPEQAAAREAKEEAGIDIAIGERLCTRSWDDGFVLHVFAATIDDGTPHAPEGILEVGWFDREALPEPRSRALETVAVVRP
jgi:ADP-ribose pyrophosphatase YjhB (NUDIX family)